MGNKPNTLLVIGLIAIALYLAPMLTTQSIGEPVGVNLKKIIYYGLGLYILLQVVAEVFI